MIVQAHSTFPFLFFCGTDTANISPIIITKHQKHIIRYRKSLIIIALYLCKNRPCLWNLCRIFTINLMYQFTLTFYDRIQRSHILFITSFAHGYITIATHTDSYQIIISLITLKTFLEKTVYSFPIYYVIPRTYFLSPPSILFVRSHHRFMM